MKKGAITNATAAAVLAHHFGTKAKRIKRLTGGLANHVFEAKVGSDEVVVRISPDAAKLQSFLKEQWAVRKVRAQRVPAPEILEVGNIAAPHPYMISLKVRGTEATRWPDRLGTARQLGELAARINTIKTSGFGSVFDWSRNQLSRHQSWRLFLDTEMKVGDRMELLAGQRMLRAADLRRLRKHVNEMRAWKGRPALTHGDVRFKNAILDDTGKVVALLDWENCSSSPAPHWEFSIALHDLGVDEKEAFLEGYGIHPKRFTEMAPWIKALNILNYAAAVEGALADKDKERLDYMRVRLRGGFDFLPG